MAVFKRRTRIVSFRLSEDEYLELFEVSRMHGAHSVSDFARLAALQSLGETDGREFDTMHAKMRELSGQVRFLDTEVKRLTELAQLSHV